jgi:hypothetical protein
LSQRAQMFVQEGAFGHEIGGQRHGDILDVFDDQGEFDRPTNAKSRRD